MSRLLYLKNLRFAIVGQEAYGENASRGNQNVVKGLEASLESASCHVEEVLEDLVPTLASRRPRRFPLSGPDGGRTGGSPWAGDAGTACRGIHA